MRARKRWVFLACLAIVLFGACEQKPSGGFDLILSETSLSIAQGATGATEITTDCDPGFLGTATLTLVSPPVGVAGTFVPDALRCGDTSTLTLDVGANAERGTHAVPVQGDGDGVTSQVQLTLIVEPIPTDAEDGFDLLVEPTNLTLLRGQQATVAVTIERTIGFVEPVALSAVVDPSAQHIDLTFEPPLAADASIMTVAVGINVPAGGYQITVQGVSDGLGGNASIDLLIVE